MLTRTTNDGWGPCITTRAAIGNRAHADVAISIHADGGPAGGRGFHVIYPPSIAGLTDDIAARSRRLALAMRDAFRAGTGEPYSTYVGRDGLDVRSDLGGLNLSDVPKVLRRDRRTCATRRRAAARVAAYRQREAEALARGLAAYLRCRALYVPLTAPLRFAFAAGVGRRLMTTRRSMTVLAAVALAVLVDAATAQAAAPRGGGARVARSVRGEPRRSSSATASKLGSGGTSDREFGSTSDREADSSSQPRTSARDASTGH